MNFHPASNIFPMMDEESFSRLKADIDANGLIESIWLFDNKILDGRNRYKACGELGIEPTYKTYKGDSPASFVVSLNVERRHLTASQRAAIAVDMLPLLEEEAKERQMRKPIDSVPAEMPERLKGDAREKAAKAAGASPRYVSDAKRIKKESPETFEQIKSGEKTVSQGIRETRPDRPKSRGKGLNYAHEAIAALKRIPKGDGMRQAAFDEVINWIKTNRGN